MALLPSLSLRRRQNFIRKNCRIIRISLVFLATACPTTYKCLADEMPFSRPDNLIITEVRKDSAFHLKIGIPETFTNRIDIFACENLDGEWELVGTNLDVMGAAVVSWSDPAVAQRRFFKIGNADVDSDGDGIPDARERLVCRTSFIKSDSDDDGIGDGLEYQRGTDPANSLSARISVYVCAQTGDDAYDGLRRTWDGLHGPKRTIAAGMDSALNGDDVQAAAGSYTNEPSTYDMESKSITLIPDGTVVID